MLPVPGAFIDMMTQNRLKEVSLAVIVSLGPYAEGRWRKLPACDSGDVGKPESRPTDPVREQAK